MYDAHTEDSPPRCPAPVRAEMRALIRSHARPAPQVTVARFNLVASRVAEVRSDGRALEDPCAESAPGSSCLSENSDTSSSIPEAASDGSFNPVDAQRDIGDASEDVRTISMPLGVDDVGAAGCQTGSATSTPVPSTSSIFTVTAVAEIAPSRPVDGGGGTRRF